ncbi:MAG: hypothetical protein HQ510_11280 [Candidatus Marinimicrobia bacterium]|nr:hypothetical protein [Candidatus Neomarinimicrobiota bacterium]
MYKIISILFCVNMLFPADFAAAKSAILPGWGEYSLGQTQRAKGFFLRESLIWLTYLGGNQVHSWYKDDYFAYANQHAGVSLSDKSYQYSVDIGNYDDFYTFNSAKDRRREVQLKYPEGEGYEWDWDSDGNRKKYDDMRITSATAEKVVSFAVGAMVVHRLVSLFDILYLKRNPDMQLSSALIPLGSEAVELRISLHF